MQVLASAQIRLTDERRVDPWDVAWLPMQYSLDDVRMSSLSSMITGVAMPMSSSASSF